MAKYFPQWRKSPNVWILSDVQWSHLLYANSMQKQFQMHLNTSSTCFERPQGRKISFRDPGPGIKWFRSTLRINRALRVNPCHPLPWGQFLQNVPCLLDAAMLAKNYKVNSCRLASSCGYVSADWGLPFSLTLQPTSRYLGKHIIGNHIMQRINY